MSQYDAIADAYDGHFGRPVDSWEDDRLAARLVPLVTCRDVLDLGCGTGWLLDHTSPGSYTGVDCSAPMLAALAAKHPAARLVKATVGEPGWQTALLGAPRFDVITATWSLQYLGDLSRLLAVLASGLAPGVIALHGYLPRYRRRGHEITGEAAAGIWPGQLRDASDRAGLPRPAMHGTGSLPDGLARTRVAWEASARLTPPRWHYAALWVWTL